MTWAGSQRSKELPPNWDELKRYVRYRAQGRCQAMEGDVRCPNAGTDCDHVQRGNDHHPSNLQWLCPLHHGRKSAHEGAAARWKPGNRSHRLEPEQHPGIIRR